jgi:poly-gamma-glutamate capsule biosynthesis protein CapA/YwtB (metallophosphatase superfamily)
MPMHRRAFLITLTAAGLAAPALAQSRRPLRVALLGQALIEHAPSAREWPGRRAIAAQLARADAVFTNLETVIKGPNAGPPTRELLTLHAAEPEVLDALKSVHVNLLATANNHAFDLGAGGILDTVAAIRGAGLASTGSGENLAAVVAFATGKVRTGGGATVDRPGVNELRRGPDGQPLAEDATRILDAIKLTRLSADVVLAYQHNHDWEPEQTDVPAWQRDLARRCIEAGASAFVGHGVPMLQGIEFHNRSPIFYGLGNFIFQTEKPIGAYPPESWQGVIVDCQFVEGRFTEARLIPLALNEVGLAGPDDMATRGLPRLADRAQSRAILQRITDRSRALGGRLDLTGASIGRLRLQ